MLWCRRGVSGAVARRVPEFLFCLVQTGSVHRVGHRLDRFEKPLSTLNAQPPELKLCFKAWTQGASV